MSDFLRGAVRSKMIWFNVFLAAFGALELMSAQLTTLFGPKWTAAILVIGSLLNVILRTFTTEALKDKVPQDA